MSSVTLKDMENEIRFMNGSRTNDISISNDLGNIIELNDINDSLGLDMISNPKMMSSNNEPLKMPSLAEVEVTNLNSFEPVTINLSDSSFPPFQAEVKKEDNNIFLNNQTSSTPSLSLEQPQSRNTEADKKEKMEYLNKLQRLEQKGFPVSRRFTLDNSLNEIKDEFDRLVDARNLEASLRFQRQALMGIVTGLEWANGKFDPFELKLDGWSESVHENVEDFDEIFEELYDKYKERGKMAPEARLVMALAGSGFMCHVSNTFLRSRMPNVDDILRNNPDIARQVAGAAASAAGPGFGNFMNMAMNSGRNPQAQTQAPQPTQMFNAPSNSPQSVAATEAPSQSVRREMKGPSGVDDILKTFEEARRNDVYMMPESVSSVTQPAVAAAVEIQSLHSEEMMSQAESTRTGGGRGGGRRKRAAVGNSVSLAV
uniref:Uncharacterized protein n=1 Tax=viral metagenome TaxID=1070528 RepID=A0A6C0D707_9ZZZZ